MSANKDLTILLTLWDRVPCTFRWMAYAERVNLPFKVLVADGGADESVPQILSNRANFPNVDYEYIRYPYDATSTDYYVKVLDALMRVETPFVVLADNDDFFLVDGLLRSIEFLRNHPDFSSCRGIIGGFKIAPNSDYGEFSNVYGDDVSFVRRVYPDKSTLENTAVERVHNYCSSYRATWYDVFRTEQTRASFRTLRDLNTQDLILSQHIPMLLGVVAGKIQVDSYLYLARQLDGLNSVDQIETLQRADLFDRMLLESWSDDFKGFVNVIAGAISEKDPISLEEARRVVKKSYRDLMTAGIVRCLLESAPPGRSVRLERRINSYLGSAGSVLRKLYPSIQRMLGRPGVNGREYTPARQLSDSDDDFKQIYEFLATPPPAIKGSRQLQLTDQHTV